MLSSTMIICVYYLPREKIKIAFDVETRFLKNYVQEEPSPNV
jgi:hypothetical protein